MTSTGLVIIPLAFLIILLPWRFSIIALLVLATLDSAAVVNAGSFGLQPGYFFGLLIIARTVVEIIALGTPLNAHVLRMLMPLFLFTMICFISIWVGLTFFQGKIMVISGAAGFNLNLAQPYMFQRQNLTQPFYLLLNVATVYALAHQIVRLPADVVAVTLERAVLAAIAFASLVAIWEMAHFYFGLPFFPEFFHSNAAYFAAHGQVLFGEVPRISGASSEPAGLAYQFAAFLMYAWYRYLGKPSTGAMVAVLLCITILAVSTSTTGFMILGLFALIVIKDLMFSLATRPRVTLSLHHFAVIALLVSAALGAYLFVQSHWYEIDGVVTSILLEKHQSSSFEERSAADLMAIDIALDTGGIGIGLGSHKPNNLMMTLLSNTGIAGCMLFGAFLFELLARPRRIATSIVDVRPYRWMIVGLLSVHAISNPNLNPLILWIGFALIIGALSVNRTLATDFAPGGKPASGGPRALAPDPIHWTSLRSIAAKSTAV